ncbi:MAG TPA: kinase [Dokdonella sp.]|jgi:D-glycerate 3-kinase|nr:kinase [Dokdonella sp.]
MRRNASTQRGFGPDVVEAVFRHLHARGADSRKPLLIGLSALQGSGKSTFAAQLVAVANRCGISALALSIDDFYYGRRQRNTLAREVHPLLAVRGVPGTHDIGLLARTLDALAVAQPRAPACLPRFDKGRDTRLPPSRWRRITRRPQWIVLEGWCVALQAQQPAQLCKAVNRLERDDDADGRWRGFVNARLAGEYACLWRRIDRLLVLQAPGFEVVGRWRDEQEQVLRRRGAARAMSREGIRRFIEYTERLSRHALATLPRRADLLLELDVNRDVTACRYRSRR